MVDGGSSPTSACCFMLVSKSLERAKAAIHERDDSPTAVADEFATPEHVGPKFVADFEAPLSGEERAILIRDAFERVDYLVRALGIRVGSSAAERVLVVSCNSTCVTGSLPRL